MHVTGLRHWLGLCYLTSQQCDLRGLCGQPIGVTWRDGCCQRGRKARSELGFDTLAPLSAAHLELLHSALERSSLTPRSVAGLVELALENLLEATKVDQRGYPTSCRLAGTRRARH